ncbi:epoxide hydrolase [Lipomyces starkeyi]
MPEPTPFKISVSDDLLEFIDQRIESARIPSGLDLPEDEAWSYGSLQILFQACAITGYQTTTGVQSKGELMTIFRCSLYLSANLGRISQFTLFIIDLSKKVEKIIDVLTSPSGPDQQAHHVIAPSLPGFAFSSSPAKPDFGPKQMAAVNNKVMLTLGYTKYIAQGGDWGSLIVRLMGIDYTPEYVETPSPIDISHDLVCTTGKKFTPGSNDVVAERRIRLQGDPRDKASDIGIRDKFHHLVDDDFTWTDEEVITWTMMYIIPGPAASANIYKASKGKGEVQITKDLFDKVIPKQVAFGASIFPKDPMYTPRWWAACKIASNIVFWKEHTMDGHFPSIERPAELVQDIRDFTMALL